MNSDIDAMVSTAEVEPQESIEDLVLKYRTIRDDLADKRHEFEDFERIVKEEMEKIEVKLIEISNALGLKALPTKHGTAYRQLKETYRVGKWEEIRKFIEETGNWQMLEKRIAKLATKEIHNTTGQLPPGVEYTAEVEMVIRKN